MPRSLLEDFRLTSWLWLPPFPCALPEAPGASAPGPGHAVPLPFPKHFRAVSSPCGLRIIISVPGLRPPPTPHFPVRPPGTAPSAPGRRPGAGTGQRQRGTASAGAQPGAAAGHCGAGLALLGPAGGEGRRRGGSGAVPGRAGPPPPLRAAPRRVRLR